MEKSVILVQEPKGEISDCMSKIQYMQGFIPEKSCQPKQALLALSLLDLPFICT